MRAVIDTGIFESGLISRRGSTGAVLPALRDGKFKAIYSTETLLEIIDVLGREKFRSKYRIEPDDITVLVNLIRLRGDIVIPYQEVRICRDPQDNKFLEVAVAGEVDFLVSGDLDRVRFSLGGNQ
ncbi:MAG: putative toxin-antitoxin system toxin component, PIN family [Anaerolineales bacterium]|nr:putative toxin-antitoxin system toxin component, PIN family [Chloroflexota bacterium]MBL6982754.1 putative toxin-antitoxin system toxin component, PIN family [Anaerolineales bacterium]